MYGYAPGKRYTATAILRHGNFLQWGYGSSPAQMTTAGRQLFINCIVYIAKFNGQKPFATNQCMTPDNLITFIGYALTGSSLNIEDFCPQDTIDKYSPSELLKHYKSNINFIYKPANLYLIDYELKSLGFKNNSDITNLDKFVEMIKNESTAATGIKMLKRYTDKDFTTYQQAKTWLDQNRDFLIFIPQCNYKFIGLPNKREILLNQ